MHNQIKWIVIVIFVGFATLFSLQTTLAGSKVDLSGSTVTSSFSGAIVTVTSDTVSVSAGGGYFFVKLTSVEDCKIYGEGHYDPGVSNENEDTGDVDYDAHHPENDWITPHFEVDDGNNIFYVDFGIIPATGAHEWIKIHYVVDGCDKVTIITVSTPNGEDDNSLNCPSYPLGNFPDGTEVYGQLINPQTSQPWDQEMHFLNHISGREFSMPGFVQAGTWWLYINGQKVAEVTVSKNGNDASCVYPQKTVAPPPPPAPAVCTEPAIFLRDDGNDVELRILTSGNRVVQSWTTANRVNDVDPSLSPSGELVAWARQDGLRWEIRLANFDNIEESWEVAKGMVRNPAVNDNGLVAYEHLTDGRWDIEVVTSKGEFLRSVTNAEQPFWVDDVEFGFIQSGQVKSSALYTTRMRVIQSSRGGTSTQAQVLNGTTVYVMTNTEQQVLVVERNALIGSANQPAVSQSGAVAYVQGGNLWVYDSGVYTQLVDLNSDVQNPVWYCNRTLIFEVDGVIYAVNYFKGKVPVRSATGLQLMTTSGNSEEQPSFSAHSLTRPELQRSDWTNATLKAMPEAIVQLALNFANGQQVVSK